jgi:hypothetical protein
MHSDQPSCLSFRQLIPLTPKLRFEFIGPLHDENRVFIEIRPVVSLYTPSILQIFLTEGWSTIMYNILDAYSALMTPFFVILVILGQFFGMGLFLAVLSARYARVVAQMSNTTTIRVLGHLKDSRAYGPAFNTWHAVQQYNERRRKEIFASRVKVPHQARAMRGALVRWFNLAGHRAFNAWLVAMMGPRVGLSGVKLLGANEDVPVQTGPDPAYVRFLAAGGWSGGRRNAGMAAIPLPSERQVPHNFPSILAAMWPIIRVLWYCTDVMAYQFRRLQVFGRYSPIPGEKSR